MPEHDSDDAQIEESGRPKSYLAGQDEGTQKPAPRERKRKGKGSKRSGEGRGSAPSRRKPGRSRPDTELKVEAGQDEGVQTPGPLRLEGEDAPKQNP